MKPIAAVRVLPPAILILLLAAAAAFTSARSARAADPNYWSWAPTPPMGWNSWDCYGAGVWQTDVLANADYMATNLKSHGWNLITIDIQWYEPLAHTTEYRQRRDSGNGRQWPAAARAESFSDDGGNAFVQTHRRLSARARIEIWPAPDARNSAAVLSRATRRFSARTITPPTSRIQSNVCRWNTDMYGVDMTQARRAGILRFRLRADGGVGIWIL